jgi:superfamily II DNA/RNA helicase
MSKRIVTWLESSGISPRGVQLEAMGAGLLDGKNVLVCSPTGSGKTLIGEMAMLRAVNSGLRGIYLVPLRALALQIAAKMKKRYKQCNIRIGISTGDFELDGSEILDYDILVTTYERADSLLRHNSVWMNEVGTMCIDEVQNISDKLRGARLESVIIRMKRLIPDLQIVALSATIGFPEQLADWLSAELVMHTERPVPLHTAVSIRPNRDEGIKKFAMTTVQRDGQCLIFNRTRNSAESTALKLSEIVAKQLRSEEHIKIQQMLDSLEYINVEIPRELRHCLSNGIGYHHAGLRSSARHLVEDMFREGLIRIISSTTTLASGMDLPARTVIISDIRRPHDYRELLPINKVHQMLGRAGRPGMDRRGFGVIIVDSKGQQREVVSRYFVSVKDDATGAVMLKPKYAPVNSHFGNSGSLEEQLLIFLDQERQTTLEHIEDGILSESFYVHQGIRNVKAPMRLLCLDEVTAESAIQRHALLETVRAARSGVLGNATTRETTNEVLGGMISGTMGGSVSCRFSLRSTASGLLEGPMCSCGQSLEDGILCEHLVVLGLKALEEHKNLANYVIPLSLGETSPVRRLVRMRLVEGDTDQMLRITRLGSLISRLYLRIATAAELLALLPSVHDAQGVVSLIRHLIGLESGREFDESHDAIIARLAATRESMGAISHQTGVPVGDLYLIADRARWLAYAVMVVSEHVKLLDIRETAMDLWQEIDSRFLKMEDRENGDY